MQSNYIQWIIIHFGKVTANLQKIFRSLVSELIAFNWKSFQFKAFEMLMLMLRICILHTLKEYDELMHCMVFSYVKSHMRLWCGMYEESWRSICIHMHWKLLSKKLHRIDRFYESLEIVFGRFIEPAKSPNQVFDLPAISGNSPVNKWSSTFPNEHHHLHLRIRTNLETESWEL